MRKFVHPVIDVSCIFFNSHPRRVEVVRQIRHALSSHGYFYAQHVPVLPADYIASIYSYSKSLHQLSPEIKKKYAGGTYTGPDIGKRELDYQIGTVSSVRSWDFSRTRFTLGSGENQYPGAELITPPYAQVLNELYSKQDVLAMALLTVFAEMFDLPTATFTDMFRGKGSEGDFGTIRLLYYPGREMGEEEAAKVNAGISPHTDFELFTLMHQDASGLQFLLPGSTDWVDAPVRPGEFVVTVGDILERFTNGELRATPHRVVLTPHPRYSIIRFNAVAGQTVVTPLAPFVGEHRPSRYSWVTMETHMNTTMKNLSEGKGAWDPVTHTSTTATYRYVDGKDPSHP